MTLSPLHYLNASASGGRFQKEGDYPSDPAQVDALITNLETNKVNKLILHFHGGLVPEKRGLEVAAKMACNYTGIGHSLGIVWGTGLWETGLLETLLSRLDLVEKTDLFKALRKVVVKKVLAEIGIQDGAKGFVDADEALIEKTLAKEHPFSEFDQQARERLEHWDAVTLKAMEAKINADLTEEIDEKHAVVITVKNEGPTDLYYNKEHLIPETQNLAGEKGLITLKLIVPLSKVTIRVLTRFWKKTDHGIIPTILEELLREFYMANLGEQLWVGMKEKATALWASNDALPAQDWHAGRYLLDALLRHKGKNPAFELNLVGHSAGAIAICHLLKCLEDNYSALLPIKNILFLAPACRTELFAQELMNEPQRFERFRMFTMYDEYEKKDDCGKVYGNSLLYLISGVLEKETHASILGLIRQLSDAKPYKNVKLLQDVRAYIFEAGKDRVVLSPTADHAPAGYQCKALKHGDFDDDPKIKGSLAFIISQ